jgi:two-component sensor histidine kinase
LNVALILHELTTNALKHGSLSVGAGCVDIAWRIEGEGPDAMLRLTWRETRGPTVVVPDRKGFGSRLISAGLSGAGGVIVAYHSIGLMCEFSARLDALEEDR